MTDFTKIIREERHYCSHLFRLLCHAKEAGGEKSGLAGFLKLANANVKTDKHSISQAEIITEVAAFRDYFKAHKDKSSFLESIYDEFLPLISAQYDKNKIVNPIRPREIERAELHPRDFGAEADRDPNFSKEDVRFYREFSALFNAKPDLLIICGGRMLWFEAKFWTSFSSKQLQRTRNIASICSSAVFDPVFHMMPNDLFTIGTQRHRHMRRKPHFIDWADIAKLSKNLLPMGDSNYSTLAFRKLLLIDESKSL